MNNALMRPTTLAFMPQCLPNMMILYGNSCFISQVVMAPFLIPKSNMK